MPYHLGHSRRPIQPLSKGLLFTTGTPVTVTDTPSAQRSYGPDGSLVIDIVLTDSPSALRQSGPDGTPAIDVVLTDLGVGNRYYGPDGQAQLGVTFGSDTPAALRQYGPDGISVLDFVITDRPGDLRSSGPDGAVTLGLNFTDTPSACRYYGPDGTAQADSPGASNVQLDSPSAIRHGGPDGSIALGVTFSDLPAGVRYYGPDGFLTYDIVLTDSSVGVRITGPDGAVVALLGDTPGGLRVYGPSGSMGIDLPLAVGTPTAGRYGGPSGVADIGVGADVVIYDGTMTGLFPSPYIYPSPNLYPRASTPDARQIRSGGPDGVVLLAFLPSKPPYIPAAPLVAPSYSLWLADTVTGRMLWGLPMDTMSWDIKLNDIGSIRASLIAEDAWDALSDQDERNPRAMLREILSGTWRFCLVLKWGNNVVWAGPYLSFTRSGPGKVELVGAEIQKMFTRRLLIKPGATTAGDVTGDTVMGPNVTKRFIAASLVSQALVGTGKSLPINVVSDLTPGTEYRTYYGYDLATYWDRLHELTSEVDGPEIRFDPKITQGVDGNYLSWDLQIGNPHLGREITPWTFDSDVNSIIGLDSDGSNIALSVFSAGSGQSRDKLITSAVDTSLLGVGWPILETVDNSHTSETSYPVLQAKSSALLTAWKKPTISFKTTVPADVDPMVGTYRVGEDFAVDIKKDPIIPDGLYSRRIAGISGSERPWVTITDVDPLPVGAS